MNSRSNNNLIYFYLNLFIYLKSGVNFILCKIKKLLIYKLYFIILQ